MARDAGDQTHTPTGRLSWRAFFAFRRLFEHAQREDWEAIPPDYRSPLQGKWIGHPSSWRAAHLDGAESRQDVLRAVVDVFREDDDESVAAWSWLDLRPDDLGVERIAVLVGTHLIGFLPADDSKSMESLVRRSAKHRKFVWADTFAAREADTYVADVNMLV
jgi:hypothetical protein